MQRAPYNELGGDPVHARVPCGMATRWHGNSMATLAWRRQLHGCYVGRANGHPHALDVKLKGIARLLEPLVWLQLRLGLRGDLRPLARDLLPAAAR